MYGAYTQDGTLSFAYATALKMKVSGNFVNPTLNGVAALTRVVNQNKDDHDQLAEGSDEPEQVL